MRYFENNLQLYGETIEKRFKKFWDTMDDIAEFCKKLDIDVHSGKVHGCKMCIRDRAITTVLNSYGHKMKLLKEDEKVSGDDCREGLTCIISVKLTEAQFEGQTKAKLGNSEIRTLVNAVVTEKLMEFLDENPAVGKAILEKAVSYTHLPWPDRCPCISSAS